MKNPFQAIRLRREEERKKLAENPEDSSSGKRCKQLYKIGPRLGKGAFSEVKEGTHKQSGQIVAIKIVNKNHLDKEDEEALQAEIDILKLLRHDRIMQLYDVFEGSDYYYLITERCLGGSLSERIADKGKYSESDARKICSQLLDAVAYTHKQHIVHRDLKLDNILLTNPESDTDIKVIDFGFAKKVDSPNALKTLIGTPGYLAPCILEGTGYGTQVDVWSSGVVLYCLLGGYPPFQDPVRKSLFKKIRKGEYSYPADKGWGDVSDSAKDMISHLLTVDPSKRVTASEALQHPWITGESDTVQVETTKGPVKRVGSKASLHNSSSMLSLHDFSIQEEEPVEHPHPFGDSVSLREMNTKEIDVDEDEGILF